jgi:hypothetical protein
MKHVPDKISVEEAFVEEGRLFEVGISLKGKPAVSTQRCWASLLSQSRHIQSTRDLESVGTRSLLCS